MSSLPSASAAFLAASHLAFGSVFRCALCAAGLAVVGLAAAGGILLFVVAVAKLLDNGDLAGGVIDLHLRLGA